MQKSFDLIIRVMGQEDARARALGRDAREEPVPCMARGGLDGTVLRLRDRGDIGDSSDALDAERSGEFLHELRVPAAFRSEPVIEMHGDQFFESVCMEPVQQRDGVPPAGDGDELRSSRGKWVRDRERRDGFGGAAHVLAK